MGKIRLTSKNIRDYANKACKIIPRGGAPVPKAKLAEELDITMGQASTLIKYMRRCSLSNKTLYIMWYPISSKHGYTFPATIEDFLPCYATLYMWTTSLQKTILPMERSLLEHGINVGEYINNSRRSEDDDLEYAPLESGDNYLTEMNADTSWFFEKED